MNNKNNIMNWLLFILFGPITIPLWIIGFIRGCVSGYENSMVDVEPVYEDQQ